MKIIVNIIIGILLIICPAYAAEKRAVKVEPVKKESAPKNPKGNYYALIIGNSNYENLGKLKTPAADAKIVGETLSAKYGFITTKLLNATRKDILNSINEYRNMLTKNDNLLIYYAGHGTYDNVADKAYWLPVDALKDNPVDWIIADDITSSIKRIDAKHIIIVSDSCYSGTLTRSSTIELNARGDRDEFLRKMTDRPSRTLMSSGGNEPVADSGGSGNSVFAYAFLKALGEMDKDRFTADELFHGSVKAVVAGKSDQVPEYKDIRNSGHEGGDFIFQLASGKVIQNEEPPSVEEKEETGALVIKSNVQRAKIYIDGKYRGETPFKLKIDPDTYTVRLEKDGYITTEETIKVGKDKETTVSMILDRVTEEAEAPAVKPATTKASPVYKTHKETYTDPTTGMEFVFVKGGCYQMGDTFGDGDADEKPVHEVCVDDFWMGKYEVTQGQWKTIMGNNPSYFTDCGDSCPVEQVSWNDVREFIQKLNEKITPLNPPLSKVGSKGDYRLPTEAEWEYAARSGGKMEKFAGMSNESELGEYAWYTSNSENKTHSVGQKKPNGLGLYDMSGNVWEWVDDYLNSKQDALMRGILAFRSNAKRLLRGGSWLNSPWSLRLSVRIRLNPGNWDNYYGFRLLRTP
jgi:formylglycine-generating enzyme